MHEAVAKARALRRLRLAFEDLRDDAGDVSLLVRLGSEIRPGEDAQAARERAIVELQREEGLPQADGVFGLQK